MTICIICKESKHLTEEHIVPEFLGGGLSINCVCQKCNSDMGKGFESILSKSLLIRILRYINGINGKAEKLSHPMQGIHNIIETGEKAYIDCDGNLSLIPQLDVLENEFGFQINAKIDSSKIDEAKRLLEKRFERFLKTKGQSIPKTKISSEIDKIINGDQRSIGVIKSPKIILKDQTDSNALNLVFIKIAYELAFFTFGFNYIEDFIATELCELLKSRNSSNINLYVKNDFNQDIFDDDYHWVIFSESYCYIKIFWFLGLVRYVSDSSEFRIKESGIAYRFCYQTQTYEKLFLKDQIDKKLAEKKFNN